ncbi:hypothetical protein BHYA_0053g00150 [Botrytis hyacinthi]|uniref:Uncharacterized protein n=1 Tax=Botrytis hyacinthi TaxID=278943 RepID=A0A4Z1GWQ2_9HELO|nr:hypothetical protein BHYA_0053g00150 [Botrytis hyacinthi]
MSLSTRRLDRKSMLNDESKTEDLNIRSYYYHPKLLSIPEVESHQRFDMISSTVVLYYFRNPAIGARIRFMTVGLILTILIKGDDCDARNPILPSVKLHHDVKQENHPDYS